MPSDNIQKHTLNLRPGDYDKIRSAYPDIGAAVVIRRLVSNFVDKLDVNGPLPEVKEIDL